MLICLKPANNVEGTGCLASDCVGRPVRGVYSFMFVWTFTRTLAVALYKKGGVWGGMTLRRVCGGEWMDEPHRLSPQVFCGCAVGSRDALLPGAMWYKGAPLRSTDLLSCTVDVRCQGTMYHLCVLASSLHVPDPDNSDNPDNPTPEPFHPPPAQLRMLKLVDD